VDLWVAAIKLIQHRPILGAGLAGFQVRAAPYFSHAHTYADFMDPHNIVLNFWVETGLLGLLSMAWIIGAGLFVSLRAWLNSPAAWRPYHLGVALALLAIVVHGMVDVPYFKNDLSLEFWALLGLSAAASRHAAAFGMIDSPTVISHSPA
jgi:O-antigen ligase